MKQSTLESKDCHPWKGGEKKDGVIVKLYRIQNMRYLLFPKYKRSFQKKMLLSILLCLLVGVINY